MNSRSSSTPTGSPAPANNAPMVQEEPNSRQLIIPGPPPTGATFEWSRDTFQEMVIWMSSQMPAGPSQAAQENADLKEKLRLARAEMEKKDAELVREKEEARKLRADVEELKGDVEQLRSELKRSEEAKIALQDELEESEKIVGQLKESIKKAAKSSATEPVADMNPDGRPQKSSVHADAGSNAAPIVSRVLPGSKSFAKPGPVFKKPEVAPQGSKSFANPTTAPAQSPIDPTSIPLPAPVRLDPSVLATFCEPSAAVKKENTSCESEGENRRSIPEATTAIANPGHVSSSVEDRDSGRRGERENRHREHSHRRYSENHSASSSRSHDRHRRHDSYASKSSRSRPY